MNLFKKEAYFGKKIYRGKILIHKILSLDKLFQNK
jgi:hypothetical protein